jgi:SWI/SNF-related matrix-associated actin-dependent regulator of chromatin subfamily B protein 1
LRAQSTTASATPADMSEPQTPSRSNGGDLGEPSSRKSPSPNVNVKEDDDRAISPVSTASSASEPPLAQKVKMNGNHGPKRPTTPTPTPAAAPVVPVTPKQSDVPTSNAVGPPSSGPAATAQTSSPSRAWLPQWLSGAMQAMRAKYPTDRFEVTLRKVNASSTPEWRIKCQDCPGKLYTPGPGETLSNYEVHLKNRTHRQRVNERLGNIPPPPTS